MLIEGLRHVCRPSALTACVLGLLVLAGGPARADLPDDGISPVRGSVPDFAAHARFETSVVVSLVATGRRPAAAQLPSIDFDDDEGASDDPVGDAPSSAPPANVTQRSLASGIVIDPEGLILTSAHAVAGLDAITVSLSDRREFAARLVGLDVVSDVALLKVDAHALTSARIGNPSRLALGDWVAAVGTPFGLERTLTAGIVSALPRYFPGLGGLPLIQTDVAINRGSSGGPLFNLRGEVVGMNALMFSDTGAYAGVSFALPIDVALQIAAQLRERGRVVRARLGARFQDLTPDLAASFGRRGAAGALITRVEPGSGAQAAGLRSGDILLGLDTRDDMDAAGVQREIARRHPGERLALNVWRDGRVEHIVAATDEVPPDTLEISRQSRREPTLARLGLQLKELDGAERRALGADALRVTTAKGAAERAGIRLGDMILAVNEVPVARVAEFDAALSRRGADRAPALLVQRGRVRSYLLVRPAQPD